VPELPEVESVRRQLAPLVTGRTVVGTERDPYPARRLGPLDRSVGGRIVRVDRRGKFLLLPLVSPPQGAPASTPVELIIHLGMTGIVRVLEQDDPAGAIGADGQHVRVRLLLDDGHVLILRDARRFGRVTVVDAGDYAREAPTLAALGPEPLSEDFTVDGFAAGLAASRASVKARLLDQRLVAGVGNIYADESLWRASIHPASRRVGSVRAARLHGAVREVLSAAVEREGTTFRDYQLVNGQSGRYLTELDVYGRAGQPCRRCGTTLRGAIVAQRGTTYCPRCQRV
jgi:formamidopyrimidine-DNA glycosylase